jgi:hypothetical protein
MLTIQDYVLHGAAYAQTQQGAPPHTKACAATKTWIMPSGERVGSVDKAAQAPTIAEQSRISWDDCCEVRHGR